MSLLLDRPISRLINLEFSYVQGMNVLLAPILYVMPELDAFWTYSQFIQVSCPLYVQPAIEGVWFGCKVSQEKNPKREIGILVFAPLLSFPSNLFLPT